MKKAEFQGMYLKLCVIKIVVRFPLLRYFARFCTNFSIKIYSVAEYLSTDFP
jgi:hypothetical protein